MPMYFVSQLRHNCATFLVYQSNNKQNCGFLFVCLFFYFPGATQNCKWAEASLLGNVILLLLEAFVASGLLQSHEGKIN